ncbi:glycosyltransferase family 2 protein [Catenulispora pinisilvae]|uniref:glycosyltransferase family 2 protein n=1 Tax=Catenulispora pinisilvae TaxID=2705253 RepID=UPI0018921C27|nr:glycosyltransferase [Catenulispora pinisilvae]
MPKPSGTVLLVLDALVLLAVIGQPLGRRFDDSDQGAGNVVKLPPFRRPSWPRVLMFLLLIAVANLTIVWFRTSPLTQLYRQLVDRVLTAVVGNSAFAAYYASHLVPLVPAAIVMFMVVVAVVLPATPGRRLMIVAHGALFLAVSVVVTCLLAVVALRVRAPLGPLPLIDLLLQETVAYFIVYRFAFTSFQFPRVTQVPARKPGRRRETAVLILCIITAVCLMGSLAVVLIGLAGGQLLVSFLILRAMRAGIMDTIYLLLGLVRIAGPPRPRPDERRPPINVIIPAFNEEVVIERTLRSIDRAAGAYGGPVEVIMCDDGSADGTRELAEQVMAGFQHASGRVIPGRHRGKAVALNLALAECRAEFVYRVDADCALDPNAFRYSIPHFLDHPDIGLVGAFVMPKEPYTTWIDRMRALEMIFSFGFARVMLAEVDAVPCIPGTFCAFRRLPALAVGGFVDGTLGEDVFFTCELARLGYRAAIDPRVMSFEDVPTTVRQLRVQRFRWCKGGIMSFAAFTPFGAGAPSPRNWFKMPLGAGKGLLKPFGTAMLLLTLEYSVLDPAVRHNVLRFAALLLATQITSFVPRFIVMVYYRRLRLLPWLLLWIPFSFLKRFFMIEAFLSFGVRPVKTPARLRSRFPTWIALLLAVTGLAAGCSTGGRPNTAPTVPGGKVQASWITTKAALKDLTADPDTRARLSGTRIFEILTGTERASTTVPVVPTMSFKSFATLQDTLDHGTLPPDIRAVIYDAEHWSQTPAAEQRDPASFYRQASALVRAHGLIFIATPAMDLVNASGAKATDPASAFLKANIAADAARNADVIDVQAQSLERDPAAYARFVSAAAAQARSANPAVTVLAGLSTNPHGSAVTPEMLVSAMVATAGQVSGYWMNVPGKGSDCPKCNAPRPDVAVAALRDSRVARLPDIFGG